MCRFRPVYHIPGGGGGGVSRLTVQERHLSIRGRLVWTSSWQRPWGEPSGEPFEEALLPRPQDGECWASFLGWAGHIRKNRGGCAGLTVSELGLSLLSFSGRKVASKLSRTGRWDANKRCGGGQGLFSLVFLIFFCLSI